MIKQQNIIVCVCVQSGVHVIRRSALIRDPLNTYTHPDGWTLSFTRILSLVLHNKWIFNDSNVQVWYHDS